MSIEFSGYNATMRRGDSETISVSGTGLFATGDTIYLTIRDDVDGSQVFQDTVAYADLVDGAAVFTIDPADTQALEASTYVWDVELKKANGSCFHIIPPLPTDDIPKFILKGDVTE